MAYLPLVLLLTSFSPNLNAFIFLSNAFQTIFEDFFLDYLPFGGWPSFCIFISSCLFLISWLSLVLTIFRWLMMYCSVGAIWWTYNDKIYIVKNGSVVFELLKYDWHFKSKLGRCGLSPTLVRHFSARIRSPRSTWTTHRLWCACTFSGSSSTTRAKFFSASSSFFRTFTFISPIRSRAFVCSG